MTWLPRRPAWQWWVPAAVAAALVLGVAGYALRAGTASGYRYLRLRDPGRTVVRDRNDTALATLTDGARTVVFHGPVRTFAEARTTAATVSTDAWVRLAPVPWYPGGDHDARLTGWLRREVTDRGPDLLAVAMQYQHGAPAVHDADGMRVAGGATYGPRDGADGSDREENSDFNDYLGVDWRYRDGTVRAADPRHRGALDCSGYVRMVFGYRAGYPLEWTGGVSPYATPVGAGTAAGGPLPRRAVMMAGYGPGVTLIPDTGRQGTDIHLLQAGDLLFFDADRGDGPDIDHVGIYLGRDSTGRPRFISSRKTANGPTMGDVGGAAVLSGAGLYARSFRQAKRL